MNIHPLALIHPSAKIGKEVVIGPFVVIEKDAVIGDRCVLESHVIVKNGTIIGSDNHIHEAVVLGGLPQHLKIPEQTGGLIIGSGNRIREHVTMHRALELNQETRLGDNNLLMVAAHVAHDCRVGSNVILANNSLLAGHVVVEDRAYVSGSVAVHQFCRIGAFTMVGGLARVIKDVPPFITIDGQTGFVVGLNTIGLRRNGFTSEQITQLKAAYRLVFRSGLKWNEILEKLSADFPTGPASQFREFLLNSHRGIVQERRMPPGATIKLTDEAVPLEQQPAARAKAG